MLVGRWSTVAHIIGKSNRRKLIVGENIAIAADFEIQRPPRTVDLFRRWTARACSSSPVVHSSASRHASASKRRAFMHHDVDDYRHRRRKPRHCQSLLICQVELSKIVRCNALSDCPDSEKVAVSQSDELR